MGMLPLDNANTSGLFRQFTANALNSVAKTVGTARNSQREFQVTAPAQTAASVIAARTAKADQDAPASTATAAWTPPVAGTPEYVEYKRMCARMAVPSMMAPITSTGHWGVETGADRGELYGKVSQYFKSIRDKYDCTDNYMPYCWDLPEYDPAIAKAMKEELYALVDADPECIRLLKNIDGVYPLPDCFDPSTMVTGRFGDLRRGIENFSPTWIPRKG